MILQTLDHLVRMLWILFIATSVNQYIIYYRGTACLSLVAVLASEGDCPLVECLVLLEPPSRLSTIRVFSSSGHEPTFYLLVVNDNVKVI